MSELTPKQVVAELDKFVIGQNDAKRAVAVAIRNRWRRRRLGKDMAREVYPKNIIMVGPTGVGKTEIARRLAKLVNAPFVKVEASKFTEVGYHGRDVESMIRDLLDSALSMVRSKYAAEVREKATSAANDRLVALLLPGEEVPEPQPAYAIESSFGGVSPRGDGESGDTGDDETQENSAARRRKIRDRLRKQLENGKLDDREVEIAFSKKPGVSFMFANMGMGQMDPDMANMFENIMPEKTKHSKVTVAEARNIFVEEETEKLIDQDKMMSEAIDITENDGILFLDEIDKIAVASDKEGRSGGPDVSRQGVQRDLLPIVEGSAVATRHGVVHTDHILFIAAGAFHTASVSDLMPELQGRFPIRVELSALNRDDFIRILTEPGNALTKQQQALLGVEGLDIIFEDAAIESMADFAADANTRLENIGARRLMTIVEKVFEEINFDAPERVARGDSKVTITAEFVKDQVAAILKDEDLSRFVL